MGWKENTKQENNKQTHTRLHGWRNCEPYLSFQEITNLVKGRNVIDFVRIMENREKRRGKNGNGKKKLQLNKEVSFEGFETSPLD